jgi:uncharacterized protein
MMRLMQQPHPIGSSRLYKLLPFNFMRWSDSEVFLSNEVGEFLFLNRQDFAALVTGKLLSDAPAFRALKSKHFLYDKNARIPIELLATKYRTKKAFLDGFTQLHLFIVTLRCDHNCTYCAASSVSANSPGYDMNQDTARRAVDLMLSCPSPALKVEFQGGEPLLNYEVVKFIHDYCESQRGNRQIEYVLCTNLASLKRDQLEYLKRHSFFLSTSLDGPKFIHDANRRLSGGSSYDIAVENIRMAVSELGRDHVSALMTATAFSLQHPKEIVDEYIANGFGNIFLRSLRPYGRSHGFNREREADRFGDFYRESLEYIIECNRKGTRIVEGFAQILLAKILTPFATGFVDIQSPCGAGIGFVAYNYDGEVYASDEGRMLAQTGDRSFYLGNVRRNTYDEIFGGPVIRSLVESSCVETLPGCSECAFGVYCGADPIHNFATQGDLVGHRPTSDFCRKNREVIRILLEYLREGDTFTKDLFVSWATSVG